MSDRGSVNPPALLGIAGFGLLGTALGTRLRNVGFLVAAFDVCVERAAMAASLGFISATSVVELAKMTDLIIISVYSTSEVADVIEALKQITAPPTVICTTTLDPAEAPGLFTAARTGGVTFGELPISGTTSEVAAGDALGIYGGPVEVMKRCSVVIEALTPRSLYAGPLGTAAKFKLAINLVLEVQRSAFAEGLVFARMLGLDLAAYEQALTLSAASARVQRTKGVKMRSGDFSPQGRVEQSLKDIQTMQRLAAGLGARLPLTDVQAGLLAGCVSAGEGQLDASAVILEIERRSGMKTPVHA